MSENATKTENTREKYSVKVDPVNFAADYEGKFISSIDFCRLTGEYFRAAFADYEGCSFDIQNGVPSISLYFTHNEVTGTRAVNRMDKKESGSTLLDKTRSRDLMYREGDRYYITDDGIDIISGLLMPSLYNGGKINWKNIVSDIVDRNNGNFYMNPHPRQITKISGIDPRNICSLIYGTKDETGDNVDYGVRVVGDLSIRNGLMPQAVSNYALSIDRAHTGNLTKTYESFGIANAGSSIIR